MNLALSALIILLFLLPAFSFKIGIAVYSGIRKPLPSNTPDLRHQLTSRNVSKALAKLNFTETVFLFSLIPISLHLVSLLIVCTWTTLPFDLLLNIFSGKPDVLSEAQNHLFQYQLKWFLAYTIIEVFIGCALGILLSWLFMSRSWMLHALMGNNIWYKIFTGLTLSESNRHRIHSILVEALVLTKETTVIYSGLLKNYEVVPDTDQLSYLTIQSPSRRDLRAAQIVNKNPNAATESISGYDQDYGPLINIPGNNLTIQGKDILNVNVTYLELTAAPTSTDPTAKKLMPIST